MGLLLFIVIIVGTYVVAKEFAKKTRENENELNALRGEHENDKDLETVISERAASTSGIIK